MRLATEDIDVIFNAIEFLLTDEGLDVFENGIGPDDTIVVYTEQFGEIYFTLGEPDDVESNYGIDVIHARFEDTTLEDLFIYKLERHMRQSNSTTEYEINLDERESDDA